MGNSQQTQYQSQESLDNLQLVKVIGAPKSLVKNPISGQHYFSVEKTFPSEQQMKKYLFDLKKKLDSTHQYYLSPIKHFVVTSNTLCSKHHKIIQIFPFEDYTLGDQIESRRQQGRGFGVKEIWSILCSTVLAMAHFTRNQIIHTTLNPQDIVINSQGHVKVISSDLSDYQFDFNFIAGFYYAPETLKLLKNRNPYSPTMKSAVFTLAMTILSAILVEDLSQLYLEDFSIDLEGLKLKLQRVESVDIREALTKMLKIAPYERICFTQLEDMLYSILETQDMDKQEEQIEKLEESIYRLKIYSQAHQGEGATYEGEICNDNEDMPDINQAPCLQTDLQNVDEDEEVMKKQEWKINIKGVLIDKSNVLDSKNFVEIKNSGLSSNAKTGTSRDSGPKFVTEQYSKGRYEGYKQNGMRHGFGSFYYDQGGKYSGEWVRNKMEGRGALYYTNGEIAYEGEWKNDQLNGYGVLYNQHPIYITSAIDWKSLDKISSCWVKYEGNFERDLKYGQGTLFLSNGQQFRGEFSQDLPQGKGIFRSLNGQLLTGVWTKGEFQAFQH